MRARPALLLACALGCAPDPSTSDTAATTSSDSDTTTSDTATTTAAATAAATTTSTSSTSSSGTDSDDGSTTATFDPCDPTPCTDQPPATCEGDVLHTYGEATCAAHHGIAMCTYEVVDIDCAVDGLTCQEGACSGYLPPAPGEVIFVELMIDPETLTDFKAEWFELHSLAPAPRDLRGCVLADDGVNGDEHTILGDEPLLIAPGALLVMAKTADPAQNGGIQGVAHAFGDAFSLTNTGDAAILRCGDLVIDQLTYDPKTWPFSTGVAISLDPVAWTAEANDFAGNWCLAVGEYTPMNLGTPGVDNPACP